MAVNNGALMKLEVFIVIALMDMPLATTWLYVMVSIWIKVNHHFAS